MKKEIIPPIGANENSYTLGYINGYTDCEAEKEDLELTWQDVKNIVTIADSMLTHTAWDDIDFPDEQKYYETVLKRYNEKRNGQ